MLTRARLHERQRDMRRRMAERPRTGRPIGSRTKRDLVSISKLRFELFTLLNAGHSPDAAVHAINEAYGTRVVVEAVRRWRASAYLAELSVDYSETSDRARSCDDAFVRPESRKT